MLRMVVIDLGLQDDPHLIFETLNARGTPLLESELIKNYVTYKASESGQEVIWGDLDDDWWRQDFTQGRLIRPRIDALLDYWLEMRTLDDVSAGKVFSVFRRVVGEQPVNSVMAEAIADLTKYRKFQVGPRAPVEDEFHYRANVMQIGAFTPALLSILSKPEKVRFGALRALESFLIRRMVCRYTTKDYNRLALDLVRELNSGNPEDSDAVVVRFLSIQEANSRRWPTNSELEHALESPPLYRLLTRGRLRLILEGIEEHYRRDPLGDQDSVPKNLTIEHVLPQSWETHWPLPTGVDEDEARHERNKLLHSIGNLTLVSVRLNPVASNAPWNDKKEILDKHNVLHLNRKLLANYKETEWNEETIQIRSRKIAEIVADVWLGTRFSKIAGSHQVMVLQSWYSSRRLSAQWVECANTRRQESTGR